MDKKQIEAVKKALILMHKEFARQLAKKSKPKK
jgi:hypothetical protein